MTCCWEDFDFNELYDLFVFGLNAFNVDFTGCLGGFVQ